ncbi:ATP:cob(I)alamin adenosyltransferase [Oceanococcus atlanticus]|uniref:Corrinoid adenosyltransferase n=1 Tax=Oceanococcus atlanticus TaxID=1317117 RepID=A0A1Y1SAD2_9GAMM|nr:cob(I)yrinic acid a,c-diamide adenosyltransferase [Oceanococcus atlanticus]ORE85395.1 ATP:cob(I)alamin adenosyltransferase [Oceanococcus atlanticus]
MGNRLSKLTTRTGDAGETGIAGNRRLSKFHPRIQAIGDVDELNCCVGVLRSHPLPAPLQPVLERIQQELFNLGGELAMPECHLINAEHVDALEAETDRFNASLPPLKDFVLPGGGAAAAAAHMARAVCRRAERSVWAAHAEEALRPALAQYLNRLSDLMFVFCRLLAREAAHDEVLWNKPAAPGSGHPATDGEQGE